MRAGHSLSHLMIAEMQSGNSYLQPLTQDKGSKRGFGLTIAWFSLSTTDEEFRLPLGGRWYPPVRQKSGAVLRRRSSGGVRINIYWTGSIADGTYCAEKQVKAKESYKSA